MRLYHNSSFSRRIGPKGKCVCGGGGEGEAEIEKGRERERWIYFKEMAHSIIGAGKSEFCRACQQAVELRKS